MGVPKNIAKSKIKKNIETKGKKPRKPKKLDAPKKKIKSNKKAPAKTKTTKPKTKKVVKSTAKPKVTSKKVVKTTTKPKVSKSKKEDVSYKNLSNVEPMFARGINTEIIEESEVEFEREEKNILSKIGTSVIISTLIIIIIFAVLSVTMTITWETVMPLLIVLWILSTLLVYLFLNK